MLAATEYVAPAIEIIDARIEQFDRETKAMRKVFDTISDFAANAGIIVGPGRAGQRDRLALGGAILSKNGVGETGLAAGVLGHPAIGVAWLANKIAPVWRAVERGRCGARRFVHAPGECCARRLVSRQTTVHSAVSVSDSYRSVSGGPA